MKLGIDLTVPGIQSAVPDYLKVLFRNLTYEKFDKVQDR